uniref:Uncharacterized protein n=1 Tax=Amphilophus citrinellus TaxID=61819 RepID=A0A3Q0RV90_AMPCI
MASKMLLRVIISPQEIRKVHLDCVPDSVDALKVELKNRLQLHQSFELQYEDEDFRDFCKLTHADDLPKEKVTLRVNFCSAVSSDSSVGTSGLTSSPAASSLSSHSESFAGRLQKNGTLLAISRDMKSEILEKTAEAIYSLKASPGNDDFKSVAIALIEKHPCIKEPGFTSGWYGWIIKTMALEMRKTAPNLFFIDDAINATYALRRQEIEEEPPVSEVTVRWPALFTERQVEFTRLMSMDLHSFYEGLDHHLVKLLQLFRSKSYGKGHHTSHLHDVPNAFANLMGLMYILKLNYPKDLRYTFEVIQHLFMGVGATKEEAFRHLAMPRNSVHKSYEQNR